jgi:long-chain acyl-CoA synthetase
MYLWEILERSSALCPDGLAVCSDNNNITFSQLARNTQVFYLWLCDNGVVKGDNIAILMENSIEYVEAFFSINKIGAIIIPVYLHTPASQLVNIINTFHIKFIVTLEKHLKTMPSSFFMHCPGLRAIFYFKTTENQSRYFTSTPAQSDTIVPVDRCRPGTDDLALILFSSGTTSTPKGVMLSNHNIHSNVLAISAYLHIDHNERVLLIKNLNHASSITGEMLVSLYNGCTLFISTKIPTPSMIMKLISKNRISVFFAVPSILASLFSYSDFQCDDLQSLKLINFYGAPMTGLGIPDMMAKLSHVNFIYSYGLTEAAPRVTYIGKEQLLSKPGSSGVPIEGVGVDIVDDAGRSLEPYSIGEVIVRGPNVMLGYYGDKELTERTLRNGWLHTGDLGYMDSEGYLYITGRKDNLIVQFGKNVYPEEIESVIKNIKGVGEVLVRGETDKIYGQKITAYIEKDGENDTSAEDIFKNCRLFLDDYKIPKEIHFVKKLEKTPSGKIVRKQVCNGWIPSKSL